MDFLFGTKDFDSAWKSFSIRVPEYFNFGFDVIDCHAEDETKRALVWTDPAGKEVKKYTFRDISRLSNQAANALKGVGVKKGDRVSSCSAGCQSGTSSSWRDTNSVP